MSDEQQSGETRLFDALYGELRALAAAHLRRERADHTLQPTALVHEAWLKLSVEEGVTGGGRSRFLALASQAMRRILVDHARGKGRDKRGAGAARVDLDPDRMAVVDPEELDLVALDEALDALAEVSERQARVVELRFFGGLPEEEVAAVLGVSGRSVQRDWKIARAWLLARMADATSA